MKFGKIPLDQAAGTILAHSTRLTGRIFKKGHILAPEDIVVLQNSVLISKLEILSLVDVISSLMPMGSLTTTKFDWTNLISLINQSLSPLSLLILW